MSRSQHKDFDQELERAAALLRIYDRVHDELESGKEWDDIDPGTTKMSYPAWHGYMEQSLKNSLRAILLCAGLVT